MGLKITLDPKFGRVESGRVGPQGQKMGPIGSGWPQKGFKFGFNPIKYLINLNEPNLNQILCQVRPPGFKFGLSWSGWAPRVQIWAEGWVGRVLLAALL